MPLLDTLVVSIGLSIAKGLLSVWLKDHPMTQSMSADLIDMIKSKTNDVLAARKGERFFEEIGDKVALSLQPVFEPYEQQPGTFGQKHVSVEAVAREVSGAIDSANISSRLLVRYNNDHLKLLAHIKRSYPKGGTGLSEVETSLYERALNLSTQYIIDLAPTLPDYTPSTFTEILQRIDTSMHKLDQVISELNALREASEANTQRQLADFERDYRAAIIRKLDRVNLFGADVRRETKRYHLTVAYVSLDVTLMSRTPSKEKESDFESEGWDENGDYYLEPDLESSETAEDVKDKTPERLPAETALSKSKRYVIVGEAGSGKTTLLQWLAVNSAANSFERKMSGWRNTVPFFLELRRFASDLPTPEQFVAKVAPEIIAQMPATWVHDLLKNGRAVLLIDGLDETPTIRRQAVYDWIEGILISFPNIRIAVTSRPASFKHGQLDYLKFQELTLVPMDSTEVRLFVEYWHKAVLVDPSLESQEQTKIIVEKLMTEMRNSTPLSRLATNPLLCAMVCTLHYDRNLQLPSDRIALYEACCSMLLEQRDIEREVQLAQYPKLNYKQKRILLDDIAYWMIKNGYSSITAQQAAKRIAARLPNMQISTVDINSDHILAMLVERSGMIRQPTPETLDFIHRTFQEYMAACAATTEGDWGLLIKNAMDDQWKETIVLAAGLANKINADALISELLKIGEEKPKQRSYTDLLAISCLETTVEVSAEVRNKVEACLRLILPPNDREQINSLVAAGILSVPYLGAVDTYSEAEAASCIQVLSRIGSLDALRKLGSYTTDTRRQVINTLDEALGQLSPEITTNSGLSNDLFATIRKFVDRNVISLSGNLIYTLSKEPLSRWQENAPSSIVHLRINHCIGNNSMYILEAFPDIEALTISGEPLPSDLYPISILKKLILLDMRNDGEDDWPDFHMPILKTIKTLRIMSESDDWPCFDGEDFPHLISLHMYSTFGTDFPELDIIAGFSRLKHVHLATANSEVPSLLPLRELQGLETVELSAKAEYFPEFVVGLDELENLKTVIINVDRVSRRVLGSIKGLKIGLPKCEIKLRKGWSSHRW